MLFLEVLFGLDLEYESNESDGYSLTHKCLYIDEELATGDDLDLMPQDLYPTSHAPYLKEKAEQLKA